MKVSYAVCSCGSVLGAHGCVLWIGAAPHPSPPSATNSLPALLRGHAALNAHAMRQQAAVKQIEHESPWAACRQHLSVPVSTGGMGLEALRDAAAPEATGEGTGGAATTHCAADYRSSSHGGGRKWASLTVSPTIRRQLEEQCHKHPDTALLMLAVWAGHATYTAGKGFVMDRGWSGSVQPGTAGRVPW